MSQTVIVASSWGSRRKYHTQDGCHLTPETSREVPLEEALKMELEECAHCSGEWSERTDSHGHYQSLLRAAKARQEGSADV